MNWYLFICITFCILFFLLYFTNLNLFNLLPSSIIIDFKKIATKDEVLVTPTQYSISYINDNFIINENGVLYIDTNTTLLNINFPFSNYVFNIDTNYAQIVPIIKAL